MTQLLDPIVYGAKLNTQKGVFVWRQWFRDAIVRRRMFKCDVCGKEVTRVTGFDLHEGIVTRGDVPKSIKWHGLVYDERNCFVCHPKCHRDNPPSREWAWAKSVERYGEKVMRDWYNGLPWKNGRPPRNF